MNKYELTLVLDAKTTPAKKKSILESLEKTVNLLKGKMNKVEDWGVKELFHLMKKNKEGAFLHIPLEFLASKVKQLDLKLKTEDNIIRYLIVKK
ncbi:MAG: 30S ribosomal protein S6 [Candidatus Woesebacteria bacterium]|nr:30S ribosomal protein S6 [Candidatus Woesebacteria bacterium]